MGQAVVLRTFSTRVEAMGACALLESQGIEAEIQSDDLGGTHAGLAFAAGVALLVAASDEEAAVALLDSFEEEAEPTPPSSDEPQPAWRRATAMAILAPSMLLFLAVVVALVGWIVFEVF